MRIIGIDPGTATTGFSILESVGGKSKLLDYGCILTPAGLPHTTRLNQIAQDMTELLKKWKPKKASVEKLFFQKNVKTAMAVAEARGVILQKLTEHGIHSHEFTPNEIKQSVCGHARADKKMVQEMVKMLLGLKTIPKPDDAADAIAASICLANSLALENRIIA